MNKFAKSILFVAAMLSTLTAVGCQSNAGVQKQTTIDEKLYENLPFSMPKVQQPVFSNYTVNVTDFGAKSGGVFLNTEAINKAIKAVNASGVLKALRDRS